VLEDDFQLGKVASELAQVLQKVLFSIQNGNVLQKQLVGIALRFVCVKLASLSSLGTSP
jgi:hypothetical protein